MATKRKPSAASLSALAERVRTLAQRHSKREIARIVGYHERSVRRWLSGESKPKALARDTTAKTKLTRALATDQRAATKERQREKIPSLGVKIPPPSKRITYVGETEPSRTIEAITTFTPWRNIYKMLVNYRNRMRALGQSAPVRFLGYGNADSEYPNEFFWSEPENIVRYTNAEIDDYLESLALQFSDIRKMRIDV